MKINYILTLILVFCIGASIPILTGSSQVNEQHSAKSEVPYCVTPPTVPAQVTFDGETIDLRRYDRRERMDREMMAFTYMHSTTMLLIKRANRYFPIIEPILKANGIPDDFKYLMVIESNLNNIARSPAGAAGLWQFMPATGREFGLEVNDNVDERYHIEKATVAACKYLKKSYARYGSWTMVAASYNAGVSGVSRQAGRQDSNSYYDLLLNDETARYVFRIVALKLIMQAPEQYGFKVANEEKYPILKYENVELKGSVENFTDYAHKLGINYKILKYFNPWLRQSYLKNPAGKTYVIKVPEKGLRQFAWENKATPDF